MTAWRNIKVNLKAPVSQRDRVAVIIVNTLTTFSGMRVMSSDLDAEIVRHGEDIGWKCEAVKALRNMGHPIITHKARHLSWYMMDGTSDEYEDHRRAVVREAYSRQISICRELRGIFQARPQDVNLEACVNHAEITAIALGMDVSVGMSPQQVLVDALPI